MKKQIIIIHGGDAFDAYENYLDYLKNRQIDFEKYRNHTRDWKATLNDELGRDFEVILPAMPNKQNAKYLEWKIWFEKFISYFEAEVVLIGHSLGGMFLAKYLSENKFSKKIRALFLVAAPYVYGADFILPKDLSKISGQSQKIFIYHSKDDSIVPFDDFTKYQDNLKNAAARVFEDKGHFNQEKFPELVEDIKKTGKS